MTITPLGANTADSGAVTVTADAGADTKGAYAEIIASTAEAYDCFFLKVSRTTELTDAVLDLAIGAAASEADFVNDLLLPGERADCTMWVFFPIPIASGSRVSARCASARVGGAILEVELFGLSGTALSNIALTGTAGVDTHGFNATDTGGVEIDPGATINTKGAYVEIVASTSHTSVFIGIALGTKDNIGMTDGQFLMDIATGAGGSESDVISNINFEEEALQDAFVPGWFWFPLEIASGSRIAIRAQSSLNDATDRLFDAVVYVFYGTLPSVGGGSGGGIRLAGKGGLAA